MDIGTYYTPTNASRLGPDAESTHKLFAIENFIVSSENLRLN